MSNHNRTKQLSPNTKFSFNGKEEDFSVVDMWCWNGSDLLTHTYRGAVAEFIVSKALDVDTTTFARYIWSDFDIEYELNGNVFGIEIKSSGYLDSNATEPLFLNKPVFSISKSRGYIPQKGFTPDSKRWADLYIFCLMQETDWSKANALKLEQWCFYVMTTKQIEDAFGEQKSISLNRLQNHALKANYLTLREIVNKVCFYLLDK